MMLVDINVMIYAHRAEVDRHEEYREWMQALVDGPEPYAVTDSAVAGLVRIVTNPRIYKRPATIEEALAYAGQVRNQPHAQIISPGPRFWQLFTGLCGDAKARGDLLPDAYLAALAIEYGCEVITVDKDFRKFPGVRWRHPLTLLTRGMAPGLG